MKMENTIVEQNHVIMALHEELEVKNRDIIALQDELTRKDSLIQEMEETILSQNESIEQLQDELNIRTKSMDDVKKLLRERDEHIQENEKTILNLNKTTSFLECELENKEKCILDVKEEVKKKEALIEEAEGLKLQVSELTNQVKGFEEVLRVKNEAIQRSNQWHIEMKKEFDTQSSFALEREENLKLEHDKEIEKLKEEFLEQFKLVAEKKSLLESFLENQVGILLNRLLELSGKGFGNKKEIETFQRLYEEELKNVKLTVSQFSENVHTEHFVKQLEEFNKTLATCFFHEEAMRDELNLKIEELREMKKELKQSKKMCDDVMSNEKQLFTNLTKTEIELNQIKDEKAQLQLRLTEANNNYEKITIEFNRERMEIEKKYRQDLDSYETDLIILNKSLQELLCNIPSNFETDINFLGSGDSSLVSLNSDVNSMISNPNIYNAQKIVTKCLYELGKLRNEMKRISQENKAVRLALEVRSKTCEEKDGQLKKSSDELELIRNKYSTIEEEKKYFENKLKYMIEENNNLNMNIRLLNSKISELNDDMKKYQEEILSLKKSEEESKNNLEFCRVPNAVNLSPIFSDRFGVCGGSDTHLVAGNLHTPDVSFQSLPGTTVMDVNVYTSTPFCRFPYDLEGGGEVNQSQIIKPQLDFQVSLLKWMEKCQQLDNENKTLTLQVQDLELLNQELKCSMRCVKEEMDIFKEKQKNLEKKLNNFISIKKQLITLHDENDLKEQKIKNLMKELDNLTSENTELFHKNLELEEMYRKHVSKLTEIKHAQNIGAFTDCITNTFNEKVKEIIHLKEEISSLTTEKNTLAHKVDILVESNNNYVSKLNNMVDKLCSSGEELEKIANEKLEVFSSNKLLKKEIELLRQRVDYLSFLRDSHWCNPSSIQLFEDMQKEVLAMFKNSFESKFDSHCSTRNKNVEKDSEKCDPLNLPEVLKMLSQQLKDEKVDFEQKANEFQNIICSMKDGNALSDDWFVQMDKMLRNILEEMKYHKEQYYRIEEALRCTGKFHDELQKQKDELRIKEHEIASVQKKWEEEKMKSRKSEGHLKMLEEDIAEKNEFIKALIEQRDKMEQEILELQKNVFDTQMKLETNVTSLEWKTKLEELRKSKQEIDEKIAVMQNVENEMGKRGSLAKDFEEAEQIYLKAVDEVKSILQVETSKSIAHIQEEHKEQIEQLQRVISEQAIRIGFLLKKSSLNLKESEDLDPGVLFINDDLRKQFDLTVYALQQLHQEEQQLLRLQLEAEKYNEIYEATREKAQKRAKVMDLHCIQSGDLEAILVQKLESVLQHDFINRLKKFFIYWHSLYTDGISEVEEKLLHSIEDGIQLMEQGKESERDKTKERVNNYICQYTMAIESATDFLHGLKEEYNSIKNSLNSIIKTYIEATLDCFEKIKLAHSHVNDSLKLKEKLDSLKKEKEELEKMHKNAIELLHADHKTEEDKIQVILTEIKKCCENGCDPNTLLKIKDDLEEKHKKELEDLRTYYVQMCANMEKQYSEDVNSLHSRMLSLSSSCSDDIISDQILFDKGGSGDHVGNTIISELLSENIVALENFSPDQMKLIEELKYKWSEDVKEMKRELELKYTKKIEQLQDRLSTFIYNNELDISVRCIKDEVMRDCKNEIENIEKEISSKMLPYHDDIESLKSDNECPSLGRDVWKYSSSESDLLWEQLVVDLLGNFASKDSINKVTKELALAALRNISEIQQDNFWKLSQFFKLVDNKLSNVESKVKEKENQLLSLQNKLNSFSQVVLRLTAKLKVSVQETKARNDLYNNTLQLEQMLEDGYNEELWPPELTRICNIFKNKFEKMLELEKEKCRNEIENEKQVLEKEKENLERSFVSDLSNRPSVDEFHRLLSERDSLKQMTLTLKSAVTQLVSYLNSCEDELNKTVVDELLKICDETPRKKGLEFIEQDNSPNFRRVHFAPEVGISDLDESEDLSSILRLQLDSCLSKLKLEAASLLGLTALQPPPANLNKQIENLQKENKELLHEISDLKLRLEKSQCDFLELREQLFSDSNKENGSTFLQDKAQYMLNNAQKVPTETAKLLEDLAKFGDKLINELQKERIDLQQQIDAADKQLKSTRQFLDEQAVERESERDEFANKVTSLQNQLRECGKNWTSHERFTTEVGELELQLKETNAHLEETKKKKELIEGELKDAIDKVWVLRDIIADLEAQLNTKSEKEALLERKLNELEAELDEQNGTQYAMAQELESLRSQSMDDGYLEQIKELQENIKVQFNSSVVRQMKSQLRDMEKGIEHRTKELETLFLTNSTNSLSSPSEEVSLREHLEWSRCRTPEQCPSPVALPVEEIARLQEKLLRHSRAEEVLIKRLRDQQLTSAKLSAEIEEMHAERDVMQLQLKKQMVQLAESNNKIDDLRHKVETAQTAANKDLISQVQDFKEKYSLAEHALDSMQNQLIECKEQLLHAEEIINKQKLEIRNLAHCDHEIVDSLRLELAAVTAERNKLEELLDKYKRDLNIDVMNALLVDKNEDIDQLQHTVALLQNQEDEEKHGSCNSKGYRVSFARDIEDSSALSEGMRLRDAPQSNSFMTQNIQVFDRPISPIAYEKEENLEYSPQENLSLSPSILPASVDQSKDNSKLLLNNLKLELKEKTEQISLLEKEVKCLKTIEIDLRSTKSELESVLSSVSEDKQFYEKQFQSLQEKLSSKDEEIQSLKKILFTKDEEIIKTTADVQALREISLNLQEKLKEATALVEKENSSVLKEELASLTLEIEKRNEKIKIIENELLACKNDLADEKELSATLKSSLNIVTKEKSIVEEKLESLKIENSNLLNALRTVEDNFEHYITSVRNLRNELFSQTVAYGPIESNVDPTLGNDDFEENEVIKLKEEVIKLLDLNFKFRTEREIFIKEINELKSTLTSNDFAMKDLTINQLQDELKNFRKIVLEIKEEKLEVFANFSAEINKLRQSINQLQESKQDAVEKWKNELSEKETLQKRFESIQMELQFEKEQNENQRQQFDSRVKKLSFCDVNVLDIPPVSYIPGLDALAEKMRKEIKLSASLDNSLLETILPDNNKPLELENIRQERMTVQLDHETCFSKIRSLERALMEEIEKAREGKRAQREKENECQALETEKYNLKLHIDRLGRLLSNQNEKINQLLSQLESKKEKIITLELNVLKEQTSSKQISSCLEKERSKAREAQREDITLIETMRQRLQNLMENEIKLKKLVIDERQKSESLMAQLNSVRALEKYRSDSDDENQKHVKKMILNEREKYLAMKVEFEKEKRTCEDLREVLARERTALCLQRDHLSKSERARSQVEKEMSVLKKQLNEELLRRQIAESKILEVQDNADSKFQKHLQSLEDRNKKSLDAAYSVIRELEQEYNDLKQYLRNQQEQDDNWKENVHAPLIQQLNEVNDNLDTLVKERLDLKRTIERLNDENTRLHNLISDLRMVSSGHNPAVTPPSMSVQSPQNQLKALENVMPFIEREIDNMLHCALNAEHHRKALAFQKRYLLVALRGYQDAQSQTVLRLQGIYHLRPRPFTRITFRCAALAVIAVHKLTKLPFKRLIRYNKKKEILLHSLKTSLSRSTAEAERLASVPLVRQPAPHSPPSRDRAIQRYR